MMSVKKQPPSLCKLYSIYEEISQEFLDETDLDSYFYQNNFYISQSHGRIVLVGRNSRKESFAIKLFQFCDLETQQLYIFQEGVIFSKGKFTCLIKNLRDFLKALITLAGVYRYPYRHSKLRLDLRSQKTILLLNTTTISLNLQIHKFVYRSDLETTILAYFPSRSLNNTAINLFSEKLSNLTIA